MSQPGLQQRLDVDALPGAGAGVSVDLQGADSDTGVVSLLTRFEAGDVQEDAGDHVCRSQVNPQLSAQDVLRLDLWTEAEETEGGQLVLGDRVGCRKPIR